MYLYFDTQGNLKEQINDQALRQGNSNINKLYVYWEKSEDNENITGLWARFKADSETIVPSSTTWITSNTYVEQTIPYDKSRDLKFFNYFKTYKFYVIDIPDAVLGESGAWLGTLQFVETNSITTLGQLAFYVSASNASVEADENINIAQWNYLIKYVSALEEEYSGLITESELKNAIDNAMANVYKYEGSGTVSDLNTFIANFTQDKNILKGWVFNVTNSGDLINSTGTTSVIAGDNVAFEIINPVTQTYRWDKFAGTIDLSNYALKSELPTKTSDLANDSNFQNQTQVQTAINNALTRVYKFQGSISVSDLNDYISSYTGDKSNLNGWVFNITDSGNLTNSSGTTQVAAGDNVAFYVYNTTSQLYEWDKLASTIDTSNFVNTNGTQEITGKKTFDYAGGIYLSEKVTTPAATDGLQAQDDNHLYWKGQRIALNSDITSEIASGVPYLTTAPTSANTSGKLKFVVLSSEPSTYYDGYYYIITGSNS